MKMSPIKTTSYWSRTHWQCWLIPQIIITSGGEKPSRYWSIGFRWLFYGGSIAFGDS